MKRILLIILLLSSLSTPAQAESLIKIKDDMMKCDSSIEHIFGDWYLANEINQLDVSYIQDNYIYTACDVGQPALITGRDMSKLTNTHKNTSTIAVLDTGIDTKNKELQQYLIKPYNPQTKDDDIQDECGHGTHIAGIITSLSNSKIMPIKVLNSDGTGKSSDIAIGIKWAVDQGAKIINLSLGGTKYDQLMKEAIDYAVEHGCIVVCASGNTYGERTVYPACLHNTISVGSIDKDGKISKYSNRGDAVDIYAYGDITSFDLNGDYIERSGTSMACAVVSAELSIIYQRRNCE